MQNHLCKLTLKWAFSTHFVFLFKFLYCPHQLGLKNKFCLNSKVNFAHNVAIGFVITTAYFFSKATDFASHEIGGAQHFC